MGSLSATLIDVGWGDSIFIESQDDSGKTRYGLIDSNDNNSLRPSYIFLKRFFEKKGVKIPQDKPVFDFVLLTHAHTDHGQGLKAIMRNFGARNFWYPKSSTWSSLVDLIRYSNRSNDVEHHQSVDNENLLEDLGDVAMEILWPPDDYINAQNENNNSVVLVLRLDNVSYVLTGDAEEEVWNQIASQIPDDAHFFKVPHHGSINGTFNGNHTPWLDNCPPDTLLAISSHIRPFSQPHRRVTELFENEKRQCLRTDEHYHITLQTDGNEVKVRYSHAQIV